MKKSFLLGVAPTRRFVFSVEDAHRYKELVEARLRQWNVPFVNIDSVNPEGLLISRQDAGKATKLFAEAGVDAVFCPHVNFGTEEVVAQLARELRKPFLLWGPRDEAPLPDGTRLRDTQCGLFASSNVLAKYGVPFSYIINSRVDSVVFERGFRTFLAAARAANRFLGARVGQVDPRPANFYTVICNEQELLSRWGIELAPLSLVRLAKTVLEMVSTDARVKEEARSITGRIAVRGVEEPMIERIAALKLALLDWAQREELSAIAFKCHEDLPQALGIYPCFVNGELTTLGVPVTCETDVHGALTALLLQAATDTDNPPFFADLTIRHPEEENGELLWHCGNFPLALARDPGKAFLGKHPVIPPGDPGTGNFELKAGELTIARFDGMNGEYSLFLGHARGIPGPYTLGSYLWVQVQDWPLWEEKLIRGPYVHHVAAIHDREVAYALHEACRFIPGLTADPATPTEEQIGHYLRGKDSGRSGELGAD
jgi:L-fucose isomerase-like protein